MTTSIPLRSMMQHSPTMDPRNRIYCIRDSSGWGDRYLLPETAKSMQATLKINKAKQVITFKEIAPVYPDAGTVKLDISSNSRLPIKIYNEQPTGREVKEIRKVTIRDIGLALSQL
ncbi:hypothetical protein FQR65_LT17211 [Abscondita terminalis]|nr:hypothetical protein FQR65_LT17211 [Abscondita terminalis]